MQMICVELCGYELPTHFHLNISKIIMIFAFACTGAPSSASGDGENFSWFTINSSLELKCNESQVIVSSLYASHCWIATR